MEPAVRDVFLQSSQRALELVSSERVARRWESPSALEEFSVSGLVGHLFRATGSVEAYLDRGEAQGPAISAASYYAQAVGDSDINSDLHRAVRQRGEEAAVGGHSALVEEWTGLLERLGERLAVEPQDRLVSVFEGLVLPLDEYLVTRLVELVVHVDDLAVSLEIEPPELPREAYDVAVGCLVEVARLRHGDTGVIRALTRRERDDIEALRVL